MVNIEEICGAIVRLDPPVINRKDDPNHTEFDVRGDDWQVACDDDRIELKHICGRYRYILPSGECILSFVPENLDYKYSMKQGRLKLNLRPTVTGDGLVEAASV
jgi:hypothetical protein